MTETTTNGTTLSPERAKAYDYSVAVRLRLEQDIAELQTDNAELRERLAEAEVKLDGMNKLNDLYRDQLQIAIDDRKAVMDRNAKYAALLAVMRIAMHEAGEAGFVDDFAREPESN